MNRQRKGLEAEQHARQYLCEQGLRFIQARYQCRFGEIDLIMRDNTHLIFVEVRYRRHSGFGGAAASVDQHKRRKLTLTAEHYLQTLKKRENARFDVIAIDARNAINWIQNAFDAE